MSYGQAFLLYQDVVACEELFLRYIIFHYTWHGLLQNLNSGLSSDLPTGAYQKLPVASFAHTDNSNSIGPLHCTEQVTGLLETTAWTCYGTSSCSRLHSKLEAFCVTQYTGRNSNSRCEMCFFQNMKKLNRCWVSYFVGNNVCNNLSFNLGGDLLAWPLGYSTSKTCT